MHASTRARLVSLSLRPTPRPLGLAVALAFVVVETLVLYPLEQLASETALVVVYLLGVVVVAIGWGFWLAAATSLASALAFDYFYIPPVFGFIPTQAEDAVALAVFLLVALSVSTLADVARSRAAEADQRRKEADLAAELSRLMLYTGDLGSALDQAAKRLAQVLGLAFAELKLEAISTDERHFAIPLRNGATRIGTLLVPADLPKPMQQRLRQRVVPPLELLLGAACEHEEIHNALEASRKELERFFHLSSDLLGIGRRPARWKRVNRAFERTFGYPSKELLSRSFLDFVHPDDLSLVREVLDDLKRGHGVTQFEHRVIRSDGSVRWLEWSVAPDQGLLYVAGRDVSERRREQDKLDVLAQLQAALRRVATLVAQGVEPSKVFSAVTTELAWCLGVKYSALWRYQSDGTATLLAARDDDPGVKTMPVGARFSLEGESVSARVLRTGRAARVDSFENAPGSAAARFRELGIRVAVGAPIVVRGRLWGAAVVGSSRPEPLPPDTEARVGDFADLVATAIANAQAHAELTASRARIVAAGDEARRRFERDLHDGAQQRLVSLGLELLTAQACVPSELRPLKEQISGIFHGLAGVSDDLREISHGIHPAILSKGGLGPALKVLGRRSVVPVELELGVHQRLPESAEVAAYYVVAEALTNVAKHAQASEVHVRVDADDAHLQLAIQDDGIGGADAAKGSGLTGLTDRVEALGGTMEISSHAGDGTSLLVTIPFKVE
ncbi:MAG: two-component system sensor kinase [Mycobacterium sp.]|nr:two-component system sensor kinase [Mycobacterium sp.]